MTVVIVGAGLIGASFGLALRRYGYKGRILGVSSPAAAHEALTAGAIDEAYPLEAACREADFIYLSQRVDRIVETLMLIRPHLRPDVLVTDAGSTKVRIARQAAESLPETCFIGGHPLAGKEQRGAAAADPQLFHGRPYILTPVQGPLSSHVEWFRGMLHQIGARVIELTPAAHDEAVAFTSHLPQLLSTALASVLHRAGNPDFGQVYGPGLTDMTRLAMSSSELWEAIIDQNQACILHAIDEYAKELTIVKKAVEEGNVAEIFESGRLFADRLRREKRK